MSGFKSPIAMGYAPQVAESVRYGDYLLLGRLAEGGMAEIFLARYVDPQRGDGFLALKRTLPQLRDDADFATMFADEARIARALAHPHICKIVDTGACDGMQFIVMEFLHGKDLRVVARRAVQRHGPLPYPAIAYILACIADALHHAHAHTDDNGHAAQIVHRDISPTNILIGYDGVPKLIDFGIAKARDRLAKTRAGTVKGKFAYMSPEQALGQPLDGRADIFALGIVLYELLTGALPFRGADEVATLQQITEGRYAAPMRAQEPVPQVLAEIVARALAHERTDRFAHARDMADALRTTLRGTGACDAAALSRLMHELFADDYAAESQHIAAYRTARHQTEASLHNAATQNLEQLRNELVRRAPVSPIADTVEVAQRRAPLPTTEITGLIELLGRHRDIERTTVETLTPRPPPAPVSAESPTVEVARTPIGQEATVISLPPPRAAAPPDTLETPVVGHDTTIDTGTAIDMPTRRIEPPSGLQQGLPAGATRPIARSDVDSARIRRAVAVANTPATPGPTRRRSHIALNRAQLVALFGAVAFGFGSIFATYYVTTIGVPAYARSIQPLLERILGPLQPAP